MVCRRCKRSLLRDPSIEVFGDLVKIPLTASTRWPPTPKGRTRNRQLSTRTGAVFLLLFAMTGASAMHLLTTDGSVAWVTYATILTTLITSVLVLRQKLDPSALMLDSYARGPGERLRLISNTLVHANGLHLLFNMLGMLSFGKAIEFLFEFRFGPYAGVAFMVLYVVSALLSSWITVNVAGRGSRHLSVGASGAIMSLIAFYTILFPNARFLIFGLIPLPAWLFLVAFIGISTYAARKRDSLVDGFMTLGRGRVDHVGHLAGCAVGAVAALIFF